MWSRLRQYERRTAPKVALYPPTPVRFVRILIPRPTEDRQRWLTYLPSEAVLNPAFSRPHGATVSSEVRRKLAITLVTLPMQFGMFS
jgi:hypothetical protein